MTLARPIVPWPGGKRRLAKYLLPVIEATPHRTYIEAFCGGAALFFMRVGPAPCEVLNDLNGELINLYRCVQHHLDELVKQFRWSLVSRDEFARLKASPPETLTDIQRAARFYYLQKTCFGGRVASQSFGVAPSSPPRLNLLRLEEDLSAAHLRLAQVTIERLHWRDCVRRYDRPGSLFFLDPPYWETEGYGNAFDIEEYSALANVLDTLRGRALLTINDHPRMREVFGALPMRRVRIRYSIGGPSARKETGELIVGSARYAGDQAFSLCNSVAQ